MPLLFIFDWRFACVPDDRDRGKVLVHFEGKIMIKINSEGTHLEINGSDMRLRIRGYRWFVLVPGNATQVCELPDVDPVQDVEGKVLDAIIAWALAMPTD